MRTSVGLRLAMGLLGAGLLLAFPAAAAATITGDCTATGTSTSGGADITTDSVWHMRSTDTAGGTGESLSKKTSAHVAAYALGIGIPIAGGSGNGDTSGSVDSVSVSTYAILGHRFVIAGSASGDTTCNGEIEIILDDVDPLFTVLGGGGIVLAAIGLVALLIGTRSGSGCLGRLVSTGFCFVGGCGAGLALEQFGVLDPTDLFGLLIGVVAALLGFVLFGIFGPKPPPAPSVAGTVGTTPDDVARGAVDAIDSAPPDQAPGGTVAGTVGSTPDDAATAAADAKEPGSDS